MSPSARSLRRPVHPADAILGRAGGPTLRADVVESKLKTPAVRRDSVSRTALVNRLRAAGAFPVVLVVAPAGYGKTSLLAQWAAKDARPFAWLSIDRRDNGGVIVNVFYKHSRIKQYLKDGKAMRIETVINARRDLGCNARLPNLEELQAKARAANRRILDE